MRRANYFVAEGDESDGTLALYHPEHAIVLNIEEEHLDYYEDLAAIEAVFQQAAQPNARPRLLLRRRRRTRRGSARRIRARFPTANAHAAFYRFDDVHAKDFQSHFRVLRGGEPLGAVTLNVPGRHNVSNAVGVIALAHELGVPFREDRRGARDVSAARAGASRSSIAASAT